jgi:hypothetical protein
MSNPRWGIISASRLVQSPCWLALLAGAGTDMRGHMG